MSSNELIKYEGGTIKRVTDAISITSKILFEQEQILIPYRKKDKWGFCTPNKKIIIDCIYDFVLPFSQGLTYVSIGNTKGLINRTGKIFVECKKGEEFIFMPRLNDSMTKGKVTLWHKRIGDNISYGELFVEVETEKATLELESYKNGILFYVSPPIGATVQQNDLLVIIGEGNKEIKDFIETYSDAGLQDLFFYKNFEKVQQNWKSDYVSKQGIQYWEE